MGVEHDHASDWQGFFEREGRYRSLTLFAVRDGKQFGTKPVGGAQLLVPDGHCRRLYELAGPVVPTVSFLGPFTDPEAIGIGEVEGVEVIRGANALLTMFGTRSVALLALEFEVTSTERIDPFIALRRRLDNDRETLMLEGRLPFDLDFHHVLLLSGEQVGALGLDGDHGNSRHRAQALVSASTQESRPNRMTARFPVEPNRHEGTVAAVTPGASLIGGAPAEIAASMALAAAQALASIGALRDIQRDAYETLLDFRQEEAAPTRRGWLRETAERLESLELELSVAVEAPLDYRTVLPVLPVEEYHHELAGSLGLASGGRAASAMVERLSSAVTSEYRALNQRRADFVTAVGAGVTALSTVAVILTIAVGFLGANVEEVVPADGRPRSLWEGHFLIVYGVLSLTPLFAGLAVLVAVRRWQQ